MLDLLDWRRTIHELYTEIRNDGTDHPSSFGQFRHVRDNLFEDHPQTPLTDEQLASFSGLKYYAYHPAYRVVATLNRDVEPVEYNMEIGDDGAFTMRQIGAVTFEVPSGTGTLGVYWIEGYGGGVFLPFRDATNKKTTYGGGRYLYDTIKGADLGTDFVKDTMVLDFNYAYHPSCYYNYRWVCPLAPPQNTLDIPIEAGEMLLETE